MNANIFRYFFILFVMFFFIGCKNEEKSESTDDFEDFMIMNIFQSNEFVLPSYCLLENVNGEFYRLDSIFKKAMLVFRFSENNCELCIKTEIDKINKLGLSDFVIGFAGYNNTRILKLVKKKYNVRFPIYKLPVEYDMLLPKEKEISGFPYLFWLETDFIAKYIFSPSKKYPDFSDKYYSEILKLNQSIGNGKYDFFDIYNKDLGSVIKGKTYNVKFKYTNITSGPLVIDNVKSSCDCTIPEWDKKPLTENQSSELTVVFTPENIGYNSKSIMVFCNKCKYPVRLSIKANVNDPSIRANQN